MLIVVPRGLPRTPIAIARIAIIAALVIDVPEPTEVETWGFVREVAVWRGPGTDYLFLVSGERKMTMRYVGAVDPELRPNDLVTAKGRWTGDVFTVSEVVRRCGCHMEPCTERYSSAWSSSSPP